MAWAFVTAAATSTKTVTKSVTAGNLLVCGFAGSDGTTTPTISDGVNSWTPVSASPVFDTTNAASVSMWSAVAATSASITITITYTPTTFNGTWLGEWSGNAAASVNAGSAGAANITGSLSADAMKTGAFTPSVDNCLIVSFINDDGTTATATQYTAGTNPVVFTKRTTASVDPAGGADTTYAVEDAVQGVAASINPSWTEAKIDAAVGIGAAFKPATGAAGPVENVIYRQRGGRGPTKGPSMRRGMPQQFPTPAPVDIVTPAPQMQLFRAQGPGMGPSLRRRFPQRFPEAGTAVSTVIAAIGAWSWSGKTSPLSKEIVSIVGAYTWTGKQSPLSTELVSTIGTYTWAGKQSPLSIEIVSLIGQYSWAGKTSPLSNIVAETVGRYSWGGSGSKLSILVAEILGSYTWKGQTSIVTIPGAGGSVVIFYDGLSVADGLTYHKGLSRPNILLVPVGDGTYTVTKLSGLSDEDPATLSKETYIIDGDLP